MTELDELKAKLAAAESVIAEMRAALELDLQIERFDCPHDAEDKCQCGTVQDRLIERYRLEREAALSSGPPRALIPKYHERLISAEREVERLRLMLDAAEQLVLRAAHTARAGERERIASEFEAREIAPRSSRAIAAAIRGME